MFTEQHPTRPPLPQRLDGRAIASIVFGMFGLAMPIGVGIIAIVLAGKVQRDLDLHGGRAASQDIASVGRALGWCGVVFTAAFVGFFLLALLFGASFGSTSTTTTTW